MDTRLKKVMGVAAAAVLILAMGVASVSAIADVGENISHLATITASSYFNEDYAPHWAAHEEEAVHEIQTEWASEGESYPWIRFEYAEPVWIDRIIISDRANLADWAIMVNITFSDGSSIEAGALENDGYPYTVTFEPKQITWVQIDVTESEGPNIGLGRVSIHVAEAPPAAAEPEPVEPVTAEYTPAAPVEQTDPMPSPETFDPIALFGVGALISAAGIAIVKKKARI